VVDQVFSKFFLAMNPFKLNHFKYSVAIARKQIYLKINLFIYNPCGDEMCLFSITKRHSLA